MISYIKSPGKTYEIVELNGSHTLVDPRDDFLGNGSGVDVLWVKAIAETRNSSCNLVELDTFFSTI